MHTVSSNVDSFRHCLQTMTRQDRCGAGIRAAAYRQTGVTVADARTEFSPIGWGHGPC